MREVAPEIVGERRGGCVPAFTAKRGGEFQRVTFTTAVEQSLEGEEAIVAVDSALGRLADVDSQAARTVELRFFGGLSVHESAEVMDVSPRTVKRRFAFARAWLFREITAG